MSGVKGLHQGRGRLIYAIITATRSTSLAIADVASPRKKPRNDLDLLTTGALDPTNTSCENGIAPLRTTQVCVKDPLGSKVYMFGGTFPGGDSHSLVSASGCYWLDTEATIWL